MKEKTFLHLNLLTPEMRRKPVTLSKTNPRLILLFLPLLLFAGCKGTEPMAKAVAETSSPSPTPSATTKQAEVQASPTEKTPISDAITALLKEKSGVLFPAETKLKSAALSEGVVKLDLSAEFAKISTMGERTESEAQKALRKTLAAFPAVQKMSVMVEGKPFTSEVTDWGTPFPVRANGENSAASNETSREGAQ